MMRHPDWKRLLLTGVLGLAFAGNSLAMPMVLAPGSTVEGKTIGDWTADWWQWALAQSIPNDAFTDPTGANASVNQSGPVFFVAGTTGGSATRSFTVPENKHLLVPLVNVVTSESFLGPSTEAELRASAAVLIDAVDTLFAEINSVPIPDLFTHRETSPLFSFTAASSNPFGAPPGPSGDAVSDGYWIMLTPLTQGTHTISFGGTAFDLFFSVAVMDTITVPEPTTLLLLCLGLAGLGFATRRLHITI